MDRLLEPLTPGVPELAAGDVGLVLKAGGGHALFTAPDTAAAIDPERLETLACLALPLRVPEVMDMLRLMLRHPELVSGGIFGGPPAE